MLYVKTEIKESSTSGKGVFAAEPISKGSVVAILAQATNVITEEQYQNEQKKGNELVIKTAVRWIGKYFLCKDMIDVEEYINHSEEPSLLYHCGIFFAKRNLNTGDELTVNYRYFLAEKDAYAFVDNKTKKIVDGLPPKQALLESAKELIALLEE